MKRVWLIVVVYIVTACGMVSAERRHFSFDLINDMDITLFDLEGRTSEGYVFHAVSSFDTPPKGGGNHYSANIEDTPKSIIVSWREKPEGELIERKIDVKEQLPEKFSGVIIINIYEDNLHLSWVLQDENFKDLDCAGYVFEKYREVARPAIESYRRKIMEHREKHGVTSAYYEDISDARFECEYTRYLKAAKEIRE